MTVVNRASISQEVDGPFNTYCAAFTNVNVGTVATTDFFTLYGSASMIVRIVQIVLSATVATAAAHFDLRVLTRSTIFTGGTPVAVTGISQDPSDPAPTATNINVFTAPPTVGTLVGVQSVQKLFLPTPGAALNNSITFNFGFGAGAKSLILRGVNQGMALDLNGATPANAT